MAGYPQGNTGYPPYGAQPPNSYAYGAAPAPSAPPASGEKISKTSGGSTVGQPSGYPSAPPQPSGYGSAPTGYGPAPTGYGWPPGGYGAAPGGGGYGAAPGAGGYGAAPGGGGYGAAPGVGGYGAAPGGGGYPSAPPQASGYGGYPPSGGYGGAFAPLTASTFPPGTDPNVMACFQAADADGSGMIDDKELQKALSSYDQSFSLRTVHLLMYLFTSTNVRKIGPKEFTAVFYSLQSWRGIFERFDRDRSGKIDTTELRDALLSLGFSVSPPVLDLLVSKFDKSGGKNRAIEYDNFVECCLTVKGLTEKFKEKDAQYSGSATFTYEEFMLTVLPFLIA